VAKITNEREKLRRNLATDHWPLVERAEPDLSLSGDALNTCAPKWIHFYCFRLASATMMATMIRTAATAPAIFHGL
jgi:hypothetical protein